MSSNQIKSVENASVISGDCFDLPISVNNQPQLRLVQTGEKFPLKTSKHTLKQKVEAADINIVVNQFADNILIVVTDINKPGSIFHLKRDTSQSFKSGSTSRGSDFLYSVDLLLGAETAELVTTARYLAQYLNQEKPILLTLGFKDPQISLAPAQARNIATFIKDILNDKQT